MRTVKLRSWGMPDYLYHLTAKSRLVAILSDGLVPRAEKTAKLCVWLSDSPDILRCFHGDGEKSAILKVDVKGLKVEPENGDPFATEWYWYQVIPPYRLEVLEYIE